MEAQNDMLSADTLAAIQWLGMPEGTPFPLSNVITPTPPPAVQPEPPADEPDAWRAPFRAWATSRCVRNARCFGGIGLLHIHFCEWTVAFSTVAPCTRQTFERLLSDAGFIIADGLVQGLLLREDMEAATLRTA